jgi:hypothetical protein
MPAKGLNFQGKFTGNSTEFVTGFNERDELKMANYIEKKLNLNTNKPVSKFQIGEKVQYSGGSQFEKVDELVKSQVYEVEELRPDLGKISLVNCDFYHPEECFIPAS